MSLQLGYELIFAIFDGVVDVKSVVVRSNDKLCAVLVVFKHFTPFRGMLKYFLDVVELDVDIVAACCLFDTLNLPD